MGDINIIMTKIKKAIFPVAGFGTRLLPATKAQPKEMLPVVDKPVIQYLVEEAVEAGIEEIIFVTGRGKHSIENHFDHSFELEYNLVEKGKEKLLKEVKKISSLAKFSYVRQPKPLGNGHALLCASHLVGDEPILVVFGDCLYKSKISTASQIIDLYDRYHSPIIGLTEISKNKVSEFGVISGNKIDPEIYEIKKIVEKPKTEAAPSNLVAVGKYVITPKVFEALESIDYNSKEIGLVDAFELMIEKNLPVYGKKLDGEWLDTGDKLSLLKANIKLGLKNKEIGNELKEFINQLQIKNEKL